MLTLQLSELPSCADEVDDRLYLCKVEEIESETLGLIAGSINVVPDNSDFYFVGTGGSYVPFHFDPDRNNVNRIVEIYEIKDDEYEDDSADGEWYVSRDGNRLVDMSALNEMDKSVLIHLAGKANEFDNYREFADYLPPYLRRIEQESGHNMDAINAVANDLYKRMKHGDN